MSVVNELIRTEADGGLSFGNYELNEKAKKEDYECAGNLYKVKTFKEITKLERDGMFVYESVPGTCVHGFRATNEGVFFTVCGAEDAQLTVGVKEDTEYEIFVDGKSTGKVKSNLGGKLNLSVELAGNGDVPVAITL
ncbi:MAG: endosialidase [Lachnospiraceae bacterium]|nr:endosialidase [Lachnospiraceae bacterium]MBR5766809.1 endosialidase [Lachnospiraceae bacterium]MBR6468812.1 endosialidase [Lachnospiraceae bacterium]MBR6486147.1 endosialidase [Lachnospiraceae bacterium]